LLATGEEQTLGRDHQSLNLIVACPGNPGISNHCMRSRERDFSRVASYVSDEMYRGAGSRAHQAGARGPCC
jgi:hypothetical protein